MTATARRDIADMLADAGFVTAADLILTRRESVRPATKYIAKRLGPVYADPASVCVFRAVKLLHWEPR